MNTGVERVRIECSRFQVNICLILITNDSVSDISQLEKIFLRFHISLQFVAVAPGIMGAARLKWIAANVKSFIAEY